jgi:hypothetical protein
MKMLIGKFECNAIHAKVRRKINGYIKVYSRDINIFVWAEFERG